MIVVRIRDGIIDHLPVRISEWYMGCMLLQLSVRLLLPGDTFGSSHSYDLMAAVSRDLLPLANPETVWGVLTFVVSGSRLGGLAANGTFKVLRRWSPLVRSIMALLGAATWFMIATGMYISNRDGTGSGTYYGLAIGDLLLAVWVSGEAGHAYRRHRHAVA